MNIWELQPKLNDRGNALYQPCTVIVTWVDATTRNGQYVGYQNANFLGMNNAQIRGSIVHPLKTPPASFPQDKLNVPMDIECKVEHDNGQYAVNGLKYSVRLEKPASKGGSGGSGGWSGGHKTDQVGITRSVALKAAVELAANGKIEISDLFQSADGFVVWLDERPQVTPPATTSADLPAGAARPAAGDWPPA